MNISFKKNKIPKIIHYVWVGEKKLNLTTIENNLFTWVKFNPDYKFMIWNNKKLDLSIPYVRNAYKLKNWANISNYMRLYALYKYGGIYLDTDIEVIKSFDLLLKNDLFVGFQTEKYPSHFINNAVLGSIKKHWFIEKSMNYLLNNFDGSEAADLSSPAMFTKLLKYEGVDKYLKKPTLIKDMKIFPKEYFYPFFYNEKFNNKCVKKNTHTIHFWDKRWS